MKIFDGAIWCASGAVAILFSGCVDLAQVNYGPEESSWQQAFRRSYPGYRPPRTPPPAVIDGSAEQLPAFPASGEKPLPTPAVEDPQAIVDKAAAKDDASAEAVPAEPAEPAKSEKDAAANSGEKSETRPETAVKKSGEPLDPTLGREVYVVKPGDDLSRIAKKFYGDARCYDPIVKANSDLIQNPNRLRPGMKLIIPAL